MRTHPLGQGPSARKMAPVRLPGCRPPSLAGLSAACALLLVTFASIDAAQAPAATKPLIPVAASSVAEKPAAFVGALVTLTGAVEQRLSSTAFSVDQDPDRTTGREVLVFAPLLTAPVEIGSYVTVIGEVAATDSDEIFQKARGYGIELPPDLVQKYRGRPAVLASSVLDAGMTDLARPLPRPLTPEEDAYDKLMKRVGPAFTALRQAIAGASAAEARLQAETLKKAFAETEAFWKTRNRVDAIQWAREARTHSESIERAAVTGRWEDLKAAAGVLGQRCQSCHSAYRQRLEDGTYRIK